MSLVESTTLKTTLHANIHEPYYAVWIGYIMSMPFGQMISHTSTPKRYDRHPAWICISTSYYNDSLKHFSLYSINQQIRNRSFALLSIVLSLAHVFLSEGYCYLIDHLHIDCHPSSNRTSTIDQGRRFLVLQRSSIDDLRENKVSKMTGFTK